MLNATVTRKLSVVGLAAFMATTVGQGVSVASVQGTRNTAIGLSAGTLYEIARGHWGGAMVLGAGSAYAWHRNSQSIKAHRHYRHNHSHRYQHNNYRAK